MKLIVHDNKWWWGESIHLIEAGGMATIDIAFQDEYPEHGYVGSLSVFERVRRKGYATVLMQAVEDIARRRGLKFIYMGVNKQAPEWLHQWYRRLGFVDRGDQEGSEGHSLNYEKDLTTDEAKNEQMRTRLVDLPLSVRSLNCLKAADVETLDDLLHVSPIFLLKQRNFGKRSLGEVDAWLRENGYEWGTIVSNDEYDQYKKRYELIRY